MKPLPQNKKIRFLKDTTEAHGGVFFTYDECVRITLSDKEKTVCFWGYRKQGVKEFYESLLKMLVRNRLTYYLGKSAYDDPFYMDFNQYPIAFYNEMKSTLLEEFIYNAEELTN